MTTKPETDRAPPVPYVDETTGERFYNVRQATQIVKGVSEGTMWRWAAKGVTSFGFELDVQLEPMTTHRPWGKTKAKQFREVRMLISEAKVLALKEILQDAGRQQPGPFTNAERATLEAVTYRRRLPRLAT